jgi:regulator of protease activity HflC (stomatin/prohibitin superfamily)
MTIGQRAREAIGEFASNEIEQFRVDARDFLSAREQGDSAITRLDQMSASLDDAAEIVNRSFAEQQPTGQFTNVISPVVIPNRRNFAWMITMVLLIGASMVACLFALVLDSLPGISNVTLAFFGPHFWILLVAFIGFSWWQRSIVMVPDGCQALITRFGKLEAIAPPGRVTLFNPWKQVSYIVNTTKEYPYNAPVREAPTASRVNASVDLFLQFRIDNPAEFIFTLGGVKGFQDKLENAISEVTRALIYQQRAESIYDLVGENSQGLLETLNQQFLPAVRFVNANITHAEPSSQEYRIDLAAPEMIRVAKEAYTYQYELQVRKEQNEGDLNKELATLRETLSGIRADIATFQARMDTARERETNRANAAARQRLVEAESAAKANAALLEAQALDIRAVSGAASPEILEYRFQQDVLGRLEGIADRLPQLVRIGPDADRSIDFLTIARQMLGAEDATLYTAADMEAIRGRLGEIEARITERSARIEALTAEERSRQQAERDARSSGEDDGAALPAEVEAISRSVSDDRVQARLDHLGQGADGAQAGNGAAESGGYGDGRPSAAQMARPVTGEEGTR